jgi:hypothetical protein
VKVLIYGADGGDGERVTVAVLAPVSAAVPKKLFGAALQMNAARGLRMYP